MENLNIEKKNAIKAHAEADKAGKLILENLFGKDHFKPQNIMERIKTFEDACEFLNLDSAQVATCGDEKDEVAYKKLKVIIRALNEGWEPNWNDGTVKFWPWMDASGSRLSCNVFDFGYSLTVVGSRLCFKSRALAEYAGKQFTDIYSDFFLIK